MVVPLGWEGAAACIGETSAQAAKKAGMQRVHHPAKPGIEGYALTMQKRNKEVGCGRLNGIQAHCTSSHAVAAVDLLSYSAL